MEEAMNAPQEEQITMEKVMEAPQKEQITRLYSLIKQNPDLLPDIDKQLFADTPLHLAAGQRRTQLALEILQLMPSFGRKLDPDGLTPLHRAIRGGHADTVSAMVKFDPELVRVRGREGITPLHYVAERDEVDILADFLVICPNSIEDFTNCGESAVHVAAKKGNITTLEVLLGWIERAARSEVLGWTDWEGNTVLHFMASFDHPQVIKKLIKDVPINAKNSRGLTALDIAMELPTPMNETLQILQQNKAISGSSIWEHPRIFGLSDYLRSPLSMAEFILKAQTLFNLGISSKHRDLILVVATLITTTTFQLGVSPPSSFNSRSAANVTAAIVDDGNGEGVIMPSGHIVTFLTLNSFAFASSLAMIYLVLPLSSDYVFLHVSLFFLMFNYGAALSNTFPTDSKVYFLSVACFTLFYTLVFIKFCIQVFGALMPSLKNIFGSRYFYDNIGLMTSVFESKYRTEARNI